MFAFKKVKKNSKANALSNGMANFLTFIATCTKKPTWEKLSHNAVLRQAIHCIC